MNLRYEILKACAANPGAPMVEICDSIKRQAVSRSNHRNKWSI